MKNIFLFSLSVIMTFFLSTCEDPKSPFIESVNSEYEVLSKKGGGDKGKPDKNGACQNTHPLNLIIDEKRIIGEGNGLKMWHYNGSDYESIWCLDRDVDLRGIAIGDLDNDGIDEIIVGNNHTEGKGRNKVEYQLLEIFEDGDFDMPSRVSGNLMDAGLTYIRQIVIGDANNDGYNEIFVVGLNSIQVWKDDGNELTMLWGENVDDHPWSAHIGDADSDGLNELIYSSLWNHYFVVYENLGNNSWGNRIISETVEGAVDVAVVGDVDGDGTNEIIGGGNQSRLYVWENIDGSYQISFMSEDLGGFTQGVGVGDFDDDGISEISVGTATLDGNHNIFVFKFDDLSETYVKVFQENIDGGVNRMATGDTDNDSHPEFAAATTGGLLIYKYISNTYLQVYSDTDGLSHIDIN